MAIVINLVAIVLNFGHWWMWFNVAALVFCVWAERRRRYHRRALLRALEELRQVLRAEGAPRPEGVRVVRADGGEVPCELVYRGVDGDGCHIWLVAGVVVGEQDRIVADVVPGHTGIEWATAPRKG